MAQFATENIRTLALVGHGASGKTTLAEALLHKAGAIQSVGVRRARHDGQRFRSDGKDLAAFAALVDPAPRNRRVRACISSTRPGFPDFIGQSIGALDAVETAAVVVRRSPASR